MSPRVCVMGVQEWGPTVVYLAENYVLTPQEVCGLIYGNSCATPTVPTPTWTLNFPPTPRPQYLPPTQPPAVKVVYLAENYVLTPQEVCGLIYGNSCATPTVPTPTPTWTLNFPPTPRPQYLPPTQPPAVKVVYLAENYVLTPQEVCGLIYGNSCATPTVPTPTWTLNFPPTPRPQYLPPTQPPAGTEMHKVLHLTDIHLDRLYSEGSNAHCEEPMCCRDIDGEPISYFYVAGKYGSLAYCDSPKVTLENLLAKLSKEQFDYILVTGDLPAHDVWNQTIEENLAITKFVNSLLKKYFGNSTLLQAVGNHESCPVDLFVPDYMDPEKKPHPMAWLYNTLVDEWSWWLPNSTFDSIRKGGYWAWEFMPGLKVVSLNGAYGQTGDWYSIVNNSDFSGMLQWTIDELQDCEDRGIKAWLISHHREFSLPYYTNQVDKIMQRYVNTIRGWFNGHTHTDDLTVYYDNSSTEAAPTPVLTAFTAPSVTTYSNSNMGYRVYYVDSKRENATFFVADHTTYYLNVTKAKLTGQVVWEEEYNLKEAYNMTGALPSDFDDLLTRMTTTPLLAQNYLYFGHKKAHNVTCDLACAQDQASSLKHTYLPDPPTH
ncbi:sphingomyelin phosphodiesterase-like [Symsagittifera roscoffensis]|uniref:sphingomyelin phosphodiesterase-like n=1 Tax=Symsagittifera roscoffensis TaxID=84072 RepID=UPI00307C1478